MREFWLLTKRKERALSIFTKTRDRLEGIMDSICQEKAKIRVRLAQDQARLQYLDGEYDQCKDTVQQIKGVIGNV